MRRLTLAALSLSPLASMACDDPATLSDRRFVTRSNPTYTTGGSDAASGGDATAGADAASGGDAAVDCPGLPEAARATLGLPCDGADADQCEEGVLVCDTDGRSVRCDDDDAAREETCNGADDDCDGQADEGLGCGPTTARACYPGTSFNFDVCFDLVPAASVTESGWTYPAATGSNDRPPAFFLDLSAAPAATKLAANFSLSELMPASSGRYALFRPLTVGHVQRARAALGVPLTVDNGYLRPTAAAPHDGGLARHPYGDAVDLRTSSTTVTLADIQRACEAEGADFTQVYTTHVHCDWRDEPAGNDFWGPQARRLLEGDVDAWDGLWADVDVTAFDALRHTLTAVWSDAFDEGTPWVRWEVTDPATGAVTVVEPAASVVAPRGARVRWQVGGVLEGELTGP
jgi:hypothetical protein